MSRKSFGKPKGHFENGAWMCNCNPRLPAVRFQSTKGKPENKGRWFYTCQKGPSDKAKCDFFLWQEDAQPRELAALRTNSRTEPGRATAVATPSRQQKRTSPPPPYTIENNGERKRGRPGTEDGNYGDNGDEEFGFDNEVDQALVAAETPRKATRTSETHTTPRRRLDFDQQPAGTGLVTPQTERRDTYDPFATRVSSASSASLLTPDTHRAQSRERLRGPSPGLHDTPSRHRDRDLGGNIDLINDVFDFLKEENVHLHESADSGLRKVLNRHSKIAEGSRRGRDVLRLELKAKEAKISGLEKQLDTLKAELEANEAARRFQQWQEEQDND